MITISRKSLKIAEPGSSGLRSCEWDCFNRAVSSPESHLRVKFEDAARPKVISQIEETIMLLDLASRNS